MNLRRVDTKLLGEQSIGPEIVTQAEAIKALQGSSVPDLDISARKQDTIIGKFLSQHTHGHILATSHLLDSQLVRVVEHLMRDIDSCINYEDKKAAVNALNETVRTWCETAGVAMTAAEIVAHGKKAQGKTVRAPNISADKVYVDQRTVVNGDEPTNGNTESGN